MPELKSAFASRHASRPPYQIMVGMIIALAANTSMALSASDAPVNTDTVAAQLATPDNITEQHTGTKPVNGNNPSSSTAIRQELQAIITSADYAESKEVKSWQPIDKPASPKEQELSWLGKLLKWLFGSQADSGTAAFLSLLLKALLVLALLAFIVWVAKRAGYLQGWMGTIKSRVARSSRIEAYSPESLAQRWQALPAHEQIPAAVADHLQQGELTTAASILYRGSLRWLMQTQQITIAPAMTEKQCLAQIQQLNDSGQPTYIRTVIQLWVLAAYDSAADTVTDSQHSATLAAQIRKVSSHWLVELPALKGRQTTIKTQDTVSATAEGTHAQ